MKEDKATLKIHHQRCAHKVMMTEQLVFQFFENNLTNHKCIFFEVKIRQFMDERNEPAKLTSGQRHQQSSI